jgi:hypothetical protein
MQKQKRAGSRRRANRPFHISVHRLLAQATGDMNLRAPNLSPWERLGWSYRGMAEAPGDVLTKPGYVG